MQSLPQTKNPGYALVPPPYFSPLFLLGSWCFFCIRGVHTRTILSDCRFVITTSLRSWYCLKALSRGRGGGKGFCHPLNFCPTLKNATKVRIFKFWCVFFLLYHTPKQKSWMRPCSSFLCFNYSSLEVEVFLNKRHTHMNLLVRLLTCKDFVLTFDLILPSHHQVFYRQRFEVK